MEEHNKFGGLGGAVAEVLAERNISVPFKRLALEDTYVHKVGSQGWLLDQYGLSVDDIMRAVKEMAE